MMYRSGRLRHLRGLFLFKHACSRTRARVRVLAYACAHGAHTAAHLHTATPPVASPTPLWWLSGAARPRSPPRGPVRVSAPAWLPSRPRRVPPASAQPPAPVSTPLAVPVNGVLDRGLKLWYTGGESPWRPAAARGLRGPGPAPLAHRPAAALWPGRRPIGGP